MKCYIYTLFAVAAVIIAALAVLNFIFYGWLEAVLYLLFAALCLTLAALLARRILRRQSVLDNRLQAVEYALDEIDKKINPEE